MQKAPEGAFDPAYHPTGNYSACDMLGSEEVIHSIS
jgi:hypothetical protein